MRETKQRNIIEMKIENKRTDTEATKLFCQVPPPNFYYFFEIAILLGLAFKLEILKQQESVGLIPMTRSLDKSHKIVIYVMLYIIFNL